MGEEELGTAGLPLAALADMPPQWRCPATRRVFATADAYWQSRAHARIPPPSQRGGSVSAARTPHSGGGHARGGGSAAPPQPDPLQLRATEGYVFVRGAPSPSGNGGGNAAALGGGGAHGAEVRVRLTREDRYL